MRWIKLYTNLEHSEVFQDAGLWQLFTLLLTKACFEDAVIRGTRLLRGQCLFSQAELASMLNCKRQTVNARLQRLAKLNCIEYKLCEDIGTLITIVNYSRYQSDDMAVVPLNGQAVVPLNGQGVVPLNGQAVVPLNGHYNIEDINIEDNDIDNTVVPPCGGHSPTTSPPKDAKKRCFKKPTIEEVKQYIDEKGYTEIDAEVFWNFYESKNWMIGKNKMSKWKSAIATWRRKMKDEINYKNNYKNSRYNDTGNQIDDQTRRLQAALLSGYASIGGGAGAGGDTGLSGVPEGLFG